jgi:hypothetical protein
MTSHPIRTRMLCSSRSTPANPSDLGGCVSIESVLQGSRQEDPPIGCESPTCASSGCPIRQPSVVESRWLDTVVVCTEPHRSVPGREVSLELESKILIGGCNRGQFESNCNITEPSLIYIRSSGRGADFLCWPQ